MVIASLAVVKSAGQGRGFCEVQKVIPRNNSDNSSGPSDGNESGNHFNNYNLRLVVPASAVASD
jgi:hypothetical protein